MKVGLILACAVAAKAAELCVVAPPPDEWKKAIDPPPGTCAPGPREKLLAPRIDRGVQTSSATRSPWIVASGWRFIRKPEAKYLYDLPGQAAPLAAAEAFAYGVDTGISLTVPEIEVASPMLAFLRTVPARDMPAVADIGVIDDGSPASGEVLNLLARRNLLFAVVKKPDPRYALNIEPAKLPKTEIANPSAFAASVRRKLTDERRSLRLYGTEMAIARLTSDGKSARVHIINYSGRPLEGVHVRVRGTFSAVQPHIFGYPNAAVDDLSASEGFSEFTIAEMKEYAILDLR